MRKTQLISGLLISALLFACSPKNPSEKPHGVLSDAQKQTLEKSKKVEDVLKDANKERMQETDDDTSGK